MARFQQLYRDKIVGELKEKFGYKSIMEVPLYHQDHPEHGCRKQVRQEGDGSRRGRHDEDRWSKAGGHQVPQADRELQDPREGSHRLHGHPARRSDVRIPGPFHHDPLPACATSVVSTGRSFDGRGNYNIGVKEQIIFPKSSTTRSMRSAWSEHQHHDDGEDRRRAQGARRVPFPSKN